MKRPPFKMLPSRQASLTCDGKFVVAGRASFVWETFLLRRMAGVPGGYEIHSRGLKRHRLEWTIDEAEEGYALWSKTFGKRRIAQMQRMRASRADRGLPVG